ncbi:MAG: hypothetical protein Q9160_001301 [Pyrenula sp. 1 TL-2023]
MVLKFELNSLVSFGNEQIALFIRMTIIASLGYIIYLACLVIYNIYFHPLSKFPGPKAFGATPLPFVLHQITGKLPFVYERLHRSHGDVVRVLPNELSFNNAYAWSDIYKTRDGKALLSKDENAVVPSSDGIYNILSTPSIADHARYRRALSPIFSERALRDQEPLVTKYVDLLIAELKRRCSEGPQDMVTWFSLVTFDIITDLTFGESLHGTETASFHPWLIGLSGSTMKFTSLQRAFRNFPHIKFILNACTPATLIEQRKKHAAFVAAQVEKRMSLEEGSSRNDFMSHILPYDASNAAMSPREVRENFGALVIAGSENVATTLDFILYHLLKHPETLSKATCEVRQCFEQEKEIAFDSLAQLTYLSAVMNEAMRITPAAPSSQPRVVLPSGGISIAGHHVPGGARVSVPPLCLHRDPRYFTNPDSFIPERWLDDQTTGPERCDRAAFQPFGVGPRSCAGKR